MAAWTPQAGKISSITELLQKGTSGDPAHIATATSVRAIMRQMLRLCRMVLRKLATPPSSSCPPYSLQPQVHTSRACATLFCFALFVLVSLLLGQWASKLTRVNSPVLLLV